MSRKSNDLKAAIVVKVATQDKLRLEQLAVEQRCSVGALVRHILTAFLAMSEAEPRDGEKG